MDLSPQMVAVARKQHPDIRFEEGNLETLGEANLGGIVAWYSLIHTPPGRLPQVFESLNRALATGGFLCLAFQAGTTRRHLESAYGHDVSMDDYLMVPKHTTGLLVPPDSLWRPSPSGPLTTTKKRPRPT